MKIVSDERYEFEWNEKTWTFYNKNDAEWLNRQLHDAKRYQYVREHINKIQKDPPFPDAIHFDVCVDSWLRK